MELPKGSRCHEVNPPEPDLSVQVPSSSEVDMVTRKLLERSPDVRVISRQSILQTYSAVFGWSVLLPEFQLQPHGELFQVLIVFMLSVVPYVLVTLVPAWTAAVTDPDQIMRP